MLSKILGAASVGSALANTALMQRFLSGLVNVLWLTVASAFAVCLFFAAGIGIAYLTLLHYGLDPYAAAIAILLTLLVIMAVLALLTASHLQKLQRIPYNKLDEAPGLSTVGGIAEAFMDGLLNGSRGSPKTR